MPEILDPPPSGKRKVITLYSDGISVNYETQGKGGAYVKLREDRYTYEQFLAAISGGIAKPQGTITGDNNRGGSHDVPTTEPNEVLPGLPSATTQTDTTGNLNSFAADRRTGAIRKSRRASQPGDKQSITGDAK